MTNGKQQMSIFAPYLDDLIQEAHKVPDAPDTATKAQVLILLDMLNAIAFSKDGEWRELWLYTECGSIRRI